MCKTIKSLKIYLFSIGITKFVSRQKFIFQALVLKKRNRKKNMSLVSAPGSALYLRSKLLLLGKKHYRLSGPQLLCRNSIQEL